MAVGTRVNHGWQSCILDPIAANCRPPAAALPDPAPSPRHPFAHTPHSVAQPRICWYDNYYYCESPPPHKLLMLAGPPRRGVPHVPAVASGVCVRIQHGLVGLNSDRSWVLPCLHSSRDLGALCNIALNVFSESPTSHMEATRMSGAETLSPCTVLPWETTNRSSLGRPDKADRFCGRYGTDSAYPPCVSNTMACGHLAQHIGRLGPQHVWSTRLIYGATTHTACIAEVDKGGAPGTESLLRTLQAT